MDQPIQMTRAEYEATYGQPAPVAEAAQSGPIKMTRAQYEATYGVQAPVFKDPSSIPSLLSDPVGALTSADWWLTRPSGERITPAQAVTAPLSRTADAMTFGLGDEIIAGGSAAVDALGGDKFSDAYDQRLKQVRGYEKSFQNASPVADFALSMAGASKIPFQSKIPGMEGVAKYKQAAKEGLGLGAAYGFGEGEGGFVNRLGSAGVGAGTGAVAGPLITGAVDTVGGGLNWLTKRAVEGQRSAVGITQADLNSAMRDPARREIAKRTGVNPLIDAFNTAKAKGIFKGSKDAEAIFQRLVDKADETNASLSSVLQKADEVRPDGVSPNFEWVKTKIGQMFSGKDKQRALEHLDEQISLLADELDGSFGSLQNAKVNLYKTSYGTEAHANVRKEADRLIANELKNTIERGTNDLAQKGLLPQELSGAVRKLNKDLGAFISLEKPLLKAKTAQESQDLFKRALGAIRTTGGVGTAILSGMYTGNPVIGALGAGAYFLGTSPGGRFAVNRGLEGLANISAAGLDAAAPSLIPGIISSENREAPRNQTPEASLQSTQTIPQEGPEALYSQSQDQSSLSPSSYSAPESDLTQDPYSNLAEIIRKQPPMIQAIIEVESGKKAGAVSNKGAMGLMQLMPDTAKALGVSDPFDPLANIQGGSALLEEEMNRFQDPYLALAAYNLGSPKLNKAIKRAGSRDWNVVQRYVPKETRDYVPKVMSAYERIAEALT